MADEKKAGFKPKLIKGDDGTYGLIINQVMLDVIGRYLGATSSKDIDNYADGELARLHGVLGPYRQTHPDFKFDGGYIQFKR